MRSEDSYSDKGAERRNAAAEESRRSNLDRGRFLV